MKSKDQILLEQAYDSITNKNRTRKFKMKRVGLSEQAPYDRNMIKNKVKLIAINVDEVQEGYEDWGASGTVKVEINNKAVDVIIHPSGEMDMETDADLSEEESEAVLNFVNSNEKVAAAFPVDDYA